MESSEVSSIQSSVVKYSERQTSGFCGLPYGLGEMTLLVAMAFMFNVTDILSCQTKEALHQKFMCFFRDYLKNQDRLEKHACKYVTFEKVCYSLSKESNLLPRKTLGLWEQHEYNFQRDEVGFLLLNKDGTLSWLITKDELDVYLPPEFEHFDYDWELA